MARKPFQRGGFPKKKVVAPAPRSKQICQGSMCTHKETYDWYHFTPAGMQIKLILCAECLEHVMRQERLQ